MRIASLKLDRKAPAVAIICPSCDSQVDFNEIIEKEGRLSCVNCS